MFRVAVLLLLCVGLAVAQNQTFVVTANGDTSWFIVSGGMQEQVRGERAGDRRDFES